MAESTLGWTDGAGKNIHTWQRSVDATNKEDQVFLPGEQHLATYVANAAGVSTATSASHLIFIQGDGTNYTRISRITVRQAALAGAAATAQLSVIRTSTAGSGGGAVSARPFDAGDTDPYAGTIQTLPSSKGTEGVTLLIGRLGLVAAAPVDARNVWSWERGPWGKPIIIGTATTNGVCLKITTGIATSTVDITVEFTLTSYL